MDGLRIRFPAAALTEKLTLIKEEKNDKALEELSGLSSFNLSLGELGEARLVTMIVNDNNPLIKSFLTFKTGKYEEIPLKIVVSLILMNERGDHLQQVSTSVLFLESKYL